MMVTKYCKYGEKKGLMQLSIDLVVYKIKKGQGSTVDLNSNGLSQYQWRSDSCRTGRK